MTLPSSRASLPPRTQRTRPVTNNGRTFPNIALLLYVPLSPRLIFVYLYLVLSHVCAAATSILQQFRLVQHPLHPSLTIMNPCPWDDNTRLHAYSNFQRLSNFHLQTCRTNADRYGRRRSSERRIENVAWEDSEQWVRNERGLAVGWAVWRRSYLNRNASATSSGLGPSESMEAQGRERAGSQSLTTRNGMEPAIKTW